MAPIALVTASTSSLPPEIIASYNIHLIPFIIQFLDGNYKEGIDITLEEFYRRLELADVVPTTAPTSVAQFIQYFEHEHPEAEAIVVFHVAAQMSKSYANAVQAAERVPHRRIINIDSHSFSFGTGLQIIEAAKALQAGATLDEMLQLVQRYAADTIMLFAPASVRYLRMSGRVGRVPALAASLLGIQPVLGLRDKGMAIVDRARSPQAARESMLTQLREFLGAQRAYSFGIGHTNAVEAAEALKLIIMRQFPDVPVYVSDSGPILAVHGGPGALGLAALRES
ncbi:MAG: DegV family protein [Herpetosiphonaceae bacterium]|nr:DegV family protein [Herpetosiphonaceae bacterium]